MRDGGEFLTKEERDPPRCAEWVQGGEGYRDSDLEIEVGAAVSGDCTLDAVPGVPGHVEGVLLPG